MQAKFIRSGLKISDQVQGQGAGRSRKRSIRGYVSIYRRPATQPLGLRWGFETTSRSTLFLAIILLFLSLAACAPKCIINGRVVDAETEHPIKGAAIAIRWVEDQPETNSATSQTFNSAQDFSDKNGYFNIPDHSDKNFVMGVYKEGYICWSNRSSFTSGKNEAKIARQNIRLADGMQVRLEPLKAGDSRDQHAGFTVLVAEEVTESKQSPFYNAIKPLFKRWRNNLRQQFRKTFGQHKSPEPN